MSSRVVVEWTRGSLRVALADGRAASWRLRAFVAESVPEAGPAGEALRAILQRLKAAGQAETVSVIPREQVLTRLVKFPSIDSHELRQMVELYAKAQLPYPPEQAVVDFHVLRQEQGVSTVGIVACQREVVERHLELVRQAGLAPGLLTLSAWGVLGWYRRLPTPAAEPVLIINVDEHRTDLVLVQEQQLLSSRSIGQGLRDWKAAGELTELLGVEAERSRASIRKELPGVEIKSIVLTGAGPLAQWSELLAQRAALPVTVIESAKGLDAASGAIPSAVSPVAAGGVALSDREALLNLNPRELRAHAHHQEQVKELTTVGVMLLAVFVFGAGLLAAQMMRQHRRVSAINEALSTIEPAADRVRRQTKSVQLVDAVLAQRRRLAAQLSGLFEQTPEAVVLENLGFERARRELIVRGHAPSTQVVLEYITQLEQLDGIEAVSLKYSRRRSGGLGEETEFELVCRQSAS